MEVFVRALDGSVVSIVVDARETITNVMERLENEQLIPIDRQRWTISFDESVVAASDSMEVDDFTPDFEYTSYEDEDPTGPETAAIEDDDFDDEEGEEASDRTWTFQEKRRIIDYYNDSEGRTFRSVQRKWRRLSQAQFSRFKAQVANGGTKWDKLREIDASVMATFIEARSNKMPVHDADLAKWALKKANEIGLKFSA